MTRLQRTLMVLRSDTVNRRQGMRSVLMAALALSLGSLAVIAAGFQPHRVESVLREIRALWPAPSQLSRLTTAITHLDADTGLLAVLLTTLSFAILGCIEYLVVRGRVPENGSAPSTVAARDIFRVSFLPYAVSHCIGGVATGMAIRMRLYTRRGWRTSEIAMIMAMNSATIWAGAALALLAAVPLISTRDRRAVAAELHSLATIHWPERSALLAPALAFLVLSTLVIARSLSPARNRPAVAAHRPTSALTSFSAGVPAYTSRAVRIPAQTLLASIDWILCTMVLFVLLPRGSVSVALCVVLFVAANAASALTHAPGGLGVFDVIVLAIVSPLAGAVPTVVALAWYRAIYYGLPMIMAGVVLILPAAICKLVRLLSPVTVRVRARSRMITSLLHRNRNHTSPAADTSPATSRDKKILYHETGAAFLMYGVSGRTWVAMGDPVGPPREQAELVQRFLAMATVHRRRPVFYHVVPATLHLYAGLGLQQRKIGECARVALRSFTLDGQSRRWLRRARKSLMSSGCTIDFVDQADVAPLLPALRDVSDGWLRDKRSREKCFSLGYFDPDYLRHCPMAIVRRGGQVIAFANIWTSGGNEEASVDLMRYAPGAPPGVIDYLLSEIMLWARQRGFAWFDLGVAPLAGVTGGRGAPLWNQIAAWMFRRGNWLYGFEGLRRYKAKYDPEWEPRYILLPPGASMAVIAADIARLIGGGARRTAAREAA